MCWNAQKWGFRRRRLRKLLEIWKLFKMQPLVNDDLETRGIFIKNGSDLPSPARPETKFRAPRPARTNADIGHQSPPVCIRGVGISSEINNYFSN